MKKKPYLPKQEGDRVKWLNNFAGKINTYATLFGITPTEVTLIQAMALIYAYIIGLLEQVRTFSQDLTKFKDVLTFSPSGTTLGAMPAFAPAAAPPLTIPGIFTFIGGIVMRIKGTKDKYTDGIGEDLGIIGDETTFISDDYVPECSGKAMPGEVIIKFKKKGVDGVNVYGHPIGSTDPNDWVKIAYDGSSPYNDTRALAHAGVPEVREYKLRGVINDGEIGQWSLIIKVTFGG
ncbi:MAG: hypothetical protein ABI855_10735 [Bacteroidota bacterium]